jgi:hypothetical protein
MRFGAARHVTMRPIIDFRTRDDMSLASFGTVPDSRSNK